MAKATSRKKTKTSGRKSGSASRKGSAGKTSASSRGATAKKAKKTTKKTRSSAVKKKTAKKAASKSRVAKKAVRKTTSARAVKKSSKKVAAKASAKKKTTKKKVAAAKAAPKKAASKKEAVKQAAPAKAPAGKAAAQANEAPPKEPLPSVEEALAKLPYHEGQFVVHPKYGLGKVDRIIERKLSTRTVPCLEISFSYQEMRLTIPVDQVGRSGLRRPISRREIDEVFQALKGRATFDAKRRSAKRVVDYRKRLNQGDPISLAEAIRDLGRLSLKKSLSYEERKILGTALRILSREVALARGREPDDVREEIEKIVYR